MQRLLAVSSARGASRRKLLEDCLIDPGTQVLQTGFAGHNMLLTIVQVQRLIAVLSVPGASRRKLLEDCSLDPGPEVSLEEQQQLEAAGWKPGSTIRSLLNFSGGPAVRCQKRACCQ